MAHPSGKMVVYVDRKGGEHLAMLTDEVEDNKNILEPSVNLVYISVVGDRDQYGAQKKRDELVPHRTSQSGSRRYWRRLTLADVRHLLDDPVSDRPRPSAGKEVK